MRVTLIHNPGAGRQSEAGLRELLALLEAAGHAVRPQSTADDDWAAALDWPADVVAVSGGDGTVARVARRMMGRAVPVAPLPCGTANNISRTLGLAGRPFEELVRGWPQARRLSLDVGAARGPWGERSFVEGVGAGLFACLLSTPSSERDIAMGKPPDERVAAALELLKEEAQRCRPIEIALTLDGKDLSGRYLLFEAVNIPYVGPNLYLAPDSKPGDGSFEVVLVSEAERDRLENYLKTWQENRERLSVLPSYQGKRLRMQWSGFALHIDDDLWPEEDDRDQRSGTIELSIAGQVEFVAPDPKKPR